VRREVWSTSIVDVHQEGPVTHHLPEQRSWLASDRPVPRRLVRPLREFLDTEAAGGIVLLAGTLVALAWANSPWSSSYEQLWSTELTLRLGNWTLRHDLRHWINDGLMTVFFFVVGLEIKRELVTGDLADRRRAALPVIAAVGGMVVPALIYAALNAGSPGSSGWGVPMATDIAFAVGMLALLGPRAPAQLKVLLLTLAIVDDIGAILVIALFYSSGVDPQASLWAGVLVVAVIGLRSMRVWWIPAYLIVGSGLWLATLASGVHATVAGVALGLLAPAHALDPGAFHRLTRRFHRSENGPSPHDARLARLRVNESLPVTERLEHLLHPWSSFVIVPLFALANAGISLSEDALRDALGSPVTWGVVLGLVAGKLLGILGSGWLAHRTGLATLPAGVSWWQWAGVAAVAGIGFTVSLFVASLAFDDPSLLDQAKVGIVMASIVASLLGALLLRIPKPPPMVTPAQSDAGRSGAE
jgi:Na+:H+ antiporter, NhaA family